jgi:hypothetical protein
MRSKPILSLALLLSFAILSCKKKKKDEPAPVPAPTPHTYVVTAKLNGTEWKNGYEASGDYIVLSKSGSTYFIGAQNSINTINDALSLTFLPSVGTHTLAKFTQNNGGYTTASGNHLTSVSGTLTITELDTSCFIMCKLKGTFSFVTDTVAGESRVVTEGVINYHGN